jgi:hypothetical protein
MKILLSLFLAISIISCGDSTVTDPIGVFENKYSLEFDGSTGYLDVGPTSDLMGASYTSISVSTWVKMKGVPNSGDGIISMGVSSGAAQFRLRWSDSNTLRCYFYSGPGDSEYVYVDVPTVSRWNHVVLTWDASLGSNQLKIYLNGLLSANASGTGTQTSTMTSGGNLEIGRYINSNGATLDGYLDEVGVWSNALTDTEVLALYNNGKPIDISLNIGKYLSSSTLLGWWRLGDDNNGLGLTVTDARGILDGTLSGGAIYSGDTP